MQSVISFTQNFKQKLPWRVDMICITCACTPLLDVYKPIGYIFIDLGANNGVCRMFNYPEYLDGSLRIFVPLKVS